MSNFVCEVMQGGMVCAIKEGSSELYVHCPTEVPCAQVVQHSHNWEDLRDYRFITM